MASKCLRAVLDSNAYPVDDYSHNYLTPRPNSHKQLPGVLQSDPVSDAISFFKEFPYEASFPVPVSKPCNNPVSALNGLDPCMRLIIDKDRWQTVKLKYLRHIYLKRDFAEIAYSEGSLEGLNSLPVAVLELIKHNRTDPDPYFKGYYNWYYSGVLDTIKYSDDRLLIHPGFRLGYFALTPYKLSRHKWTPVNKHQCEVLLNQKTPIFQINSCSNHFAIRQKHHVSLFSTTPSKKKSLEVVMRSTFGHEVPFVSLDLNTTEMCLVDVNRQIMLRDLETDRLVSSLTLEVDKKTEDKWSQVYFTDPNTVLLADRSYVKLIDRRVMETPAKGWSISGVTGSCEVVGAVAKGRDNHHYIAATHHLLGLDIREGVTQRWAHGATQIPSMARVISRDGLLDTVVLGTQAGAVVVIENQFDESSPPLSHSHPLTLPKICETLHSARTEGLCLSPIFQYRFNMSLTGLCLLEDENLNILLSTSVGDVFNQCLTKTSTPRHSSIVQNLSDNDAEALECWADACEKCFIEEDNEYPATSIAAASEIRDLLASEDTEIEATTKFAPPGDSGESSSEPEPWMVSKEHLKSCKDYLAPTLLEVWNIDQIQNWVGDVDLPEVLSDESDEDVTIKIVNWLQASDFDKAPENENAKEESLSTMQPGNDEEAAISDGEADRLMDIIKDDRVPS